MRNKTRKYCLYCGRKTTTKNEAGVVRDFCENCGIFFYNNPLPIVSTILTHERRIALVKRKNEPYKDMWCLPSGFAEAGETISEAALRELEEETGIKGKIVSMVDVDSCSNYFYGDLLFITFEVEKVGGNLMAGDDAADVDFFQLDRMPKLAFNSNQKALNAYVEGKKEYWAIVDSFTLVLENEPENGGKKNLISDHLVRLIEENSELIAKRWVADIRANPSTPSYQKLDRKLLFKRVHQVVSHFGMWLDGSYGRNDIVSFYKGIGKKRKKEGVTVSESVSSLSLVRKHIWEFALSQGIWEKPLDIYMTLELERRMMLFFDRATYYVTMGYEDHA